MEDFRILDPDPYNNSTGSASLGWLYVLFTRPRVRDPARNPPPQPYSVLNIVNSVAEPEPKINNFGSATLIVNVKLWKTPIQKSSEIIVLIFFYDTVYWLPMGGREVVSSRVGNQARLSRFSTNTLLQYRRDHHNHRVITHKGQSPVVFFKIGIFGWLFSSSRHCMCIYSILVDLRRKGGNSSVDLSLLVSLYSKNLDEQT